MYTCLYSCIPGNTCVYYCIPVYSCVYMCILCICVYTCIYLRKQNYKRAYLCIVVYTCVCLCIIVYASVNPYILVYLYLCIRVYTCVYPCILVCTIMHLYMKGTTQGMSAIHPSGRFELSIYPRVCGCQATNASPLALVKTNRFVIVLWYKSAVPWVSRVYGI